MKYLLSQIPNVHECIRLLQQLPEVEHIPLSRIKRYTRIFIDDVRQRILQGRFTGALSLDDDGILPKLIMFIQTQHRSRLKKVINATGVIIHTNLGRSLLPAQAGEALLATALGYSNLEFDLESGKRGSRYQLVEEIICELTGAEAALVVNNNAAAVLLVLETLAKGKEVIVSRGQLVEIGGSFRIPDVMQKSGAILVEVGTTNRTHLSDYVSALTNETGIFLKVHCSNYRIIGFTAEVTNEALVDLGRKHDIPVVEDLGSGSFIDLSTFGLQKEPTVSEVVSSGVDVVTFSGDKLLGGPQAGLIIGKQKYIDRIKQNPMNRALRIDKLTLAALESVLRCYLDEQSAVAEIPTLQMITASVEQVEKKAVDCMKRVREQCGDCCQLDVIDVESRIGGGAMPEEGLASKALQVKPSNGTIGQLELLLRKGDTPLIGRTEKDALLFDMRTVLDDEVGLTAEILVNFLKKEK